MFYNSAMSSWKARSFTVFGKIRKNQCEGILNIRIKFSKNEYFVNDFFLTDTLTINFATQKITICQIK